MSEEPTMQADTLVSGFPELEIPLIETPSPEELSRRKVRIARARSLRDEIGPIGISTDELLHASREDSEE